MWSSDISKIEMASVREDRPNLMWKPSPGRLTNIHHFQSVVNHSFGLNLGKFCFLNNDFMLQISFVFISRSKNVFVLFLECKPKLVTV